MRVDLVKITYKKFYTRILLDNFVKLDLLTTIALIVWENLYWLFNIAWGNQLYGRLNIEELSFIYKQNAVYV